MTNKRKRSNTETEQVKKPRVKGLTATAYHSRGCNKSNKGLYEEAIEDYTEALKLKSGYASAYFNRGVAYDELKQYEKAIADYSETLKLKPRLANVYNNRGVVYRKLKQYEKAIADYDEALTINPRFADAYYNRGWAYDELEQYEKAIADYNEALNIKPKDAEAYNDRGWAYHNLKQYEKAIADYNKALKLNPEYAKAYHNRAYSYDKLGEYKKAMADYDEMLTINPDDADAYLSRGEVKYKLSQYELGTLDYDKGIEIVNDYVLNHNDKQLLENKLNDIQVYIDALIPMSVNQPEAKIALDKLNQLKKTMEQKLNHAVQASNSNPNIQSPNTLDALQFTSDRLSTAAASQEPAALDVPNGLVDSLHRSSQPASIEKMTDSQIEFFLDNLSQNSEFIAAQEQSLGPMLELNAQPMLSLLWGAVGQQAAQADAGSASSSTETTSSKKNQSKEQASPANPQVKLRKFQPKFQPGMVVDSEEGFEYFIGKAKSKNTMFINTINDEPKPKKTSYSEDDKLKIGRWGEEHVYKKMLRPGASYLNKKYPDYEFSKEYPKQVPKKVVVKERNSQGEIAYHQTEVMIDQHVQQFVDKTNPNNRIDIIWNNAKEESRMSYDFQIVKYRDNTIKHKHTIEVKTTTDGKEKKFKISENESLKIFKSHNNPMRSYSIFRVYNAGFLGKERPGITVIEQPSQKIIDRELRLKSMTLKS
ncbi:MAG: hypothetical protein K0S11_745 [Gammaproteobacteria bacterium]|jgi:tetratricopeptide (TPR) repeat protein|nr:hypothetical protein [Gammaproteobacteria bacterium]